MKRLFWLTIVIVCIRFENSVAGACDADPCNIHTFHEPYCQCRGDSGKHASYIDNLKKERERLIKRQNTKLSPYERALLNDSINTMPVLIADCDSCFLGRCQLIDTCKMETYRFKQLKGIVLEYSKNILDTSNCKVNDTTGERIFWRYFRHLMNIVDTTKNTQISIDGLALLRNIVFADKNLMQLIRQKNAKELFELFKNDPRTIDTIMKTARYLYNNVKDPRDLERIVELQKTYNKNVREWAQFLGNSLLLDTADTALPRSLDSLAQRAKILLGNSNDTPYIAILTNRRKGKESIEPLAGNMQSFNAVLMKALNTSYHMIPLPGEIGFYDIRDSLSRALSVGYRIPSNSKELVLKKLHELPNNKHARYFITGEYIVKGDSVCFSMVLVDADDGLVLIPFGATCKLSSGQDIDRAVAELIDKMQNGIKALVYLSFKVDLKTLKYLRPQDVYTYLYSRSILTVKSAQNITDTAFKRITGITLGTPFGEGDAVTIYADLEGHLDAALEAHYNRPNSSTAFPYYSKKKPDAKDSIPLRITCKSLPRPDNGVELSGSFRGSRFVAISVQFLDTASDYKEANYAAAAQYLTASLDGFFIGSRSITTKELSGETKVTYKDTCYNKNTSHCEDTNHFTLPHSPLGYYLPLAFVPAGIPHLIKTCYSDSVYKWKYLKYGGLLLVCQVGGGFLWYYGFSKFNVYNNDNTILMKQSQYNSRFIAGGLYGAYVGILQGLSVVTLAHIDILEYKDKRNKLVLNQPTDKIQLSPLFNPSNGESGIMFSWRF